MSKVIFVTGASGFLGSHIVTLLLSEGYSVRAAARGAKVAELESTYASFGERFQAVNIPDIATSQFPESLKGVYAVIHSAAPLANRAPAEEILRGAVEGTLNVVRQAEKAGITRIVVTSTTATVSNPSLSYTDKDWNPITKDEILKSSSAFGVYAGSKTHAELALWAFADAHLHVDITTINPPYLYGPFAETFKLPSPDYYALSTNIQIYRLITPDGAYPPGPLYVDVRDAAKAHVLALKSPLSSVPGIGRKRIIFASLDAFDYKSSLELLAKERPELKDRLTRVDIPAVPLKKIPFDVKRVEQVLNFKVEDYTPFESTFLAAIDAVLDVERKWAALGHVVNIPAA